MKNNKKESRQQAGDGRQGKTKSQSKSFLSTLSFLPSTLDRLLSTQAKGFSLVELLISLGIFSVIMAVVFSSYLSQMRNTSREYRVAEAEVEVGIAKNIIERDIAMAGYGLAEDYSDATSPAVTAPLAASATNGNPDTLTLSGTALGINSRQAQTWTYMTAAASGPPATATFQTWTDARESLSSNDRVIIMEPATKKLLAQGGRWLFIYNGSGSIVTTQTGGTDYATPAVGTLVYGLYGAGVTEATQPFYAVRYYLSGTPPAICATGTQSLLRAESRTCPGTTNCAVAGGDPILDCVLDMEVSLGLDSNEDGVIDLWDEGGATAFGYAAADLRKRLKQIRVYLLVQSGNLDTSYTSPASIRVGDSVLGTGRDVDMTTVAQRRNYRWRILSITVTPRNIR